MTPDGLRLLVLAGNNPGALYIIDAINGNLQTGGKISISGTPKEVAVTPDSRYAYIISAATPATILTVVDLTTNQAVNQTQLPGLIGALHVSVSPVGQVYVTAQYRLVEFDGRAPFAEHARSEIISNPGRLQFSPDGRYALSINEFQNGSSIVCIDLAVKGATTGAGTESRFQITTSSNPSLRIDDIFVVNPTTAIAYSNTDQRLFAVGFPTLSASDLVLSGTGVVTGVTSVTRSNEFPTTRNLYYTSGGKLSRFDLVHKNTGLGTSDVGNGIAVFVPTPNVGGTPTTLFTYGGGGNVGPNVTYPMSVRAVDSTGRPVYGATVTFSSETAVLAGAATTTNVDGYGWVVVTTPPANGDFVVRAMVGTQRPVSPPPSLAALAAVPEAVVAAPIQAMLPRSSRSPAMASSSKTYSRFRYFHWW
ncbi:MAG: hypothetical protein QM757_40685 [Paludibaculum sp.]